MGSPIVVLRLFFSPYIYVGLTFQFVRAQLNPLESYRPMDSPSPLSFFFSNCIRFEGWGRVNRIKADGADVEKSWWRRKKVCMGVAWIHPSTSITNDVEVPVWKVDIQQLKSNGDRWKYRRLLQRKRVVGDSWRERKEKSWMRQCKCNENPRLLCKAIIYKSIDDDDAVTRGCSSVEFVLC